MRGHARTACDFVRNTTFHTEGVSPCSEATVLENVDILAVLCMSVGTEQVVHEFLKFLGWTFYLEPQRPPQKGSDTTFVWCLGVCRLWDLRAFRLNKVDATRGSATELRVSSSWHVSGIVDNAVLWVLLFGVRWK